MASVAEGIVGDGEGGGLAPERVWLLCRSLARGERGLLYSSEKIIVEEDGEDDWSS